MIPIQDRYSLSEVIDPAVLPYNASVDNNPYERMKRYIGFTQTDADALAELAEPMAPHIPSIVNKFYEVVLRDPLATAIFTAEPGRSERLHDTLCDWIAGLFVGRYDESHYRRSHAIGRTHVRVKLPQDYMFTGMNVLRRSLLGQIRQLALPEIDVKVAAVEKLLDLELAIMNRAYSDSLLEQMQQFEQDRFERQLGESRHLAIVGELAASLAHEVKNPLAGISGAIQVIRASLDDQHPHREIIDEAMLQIDRLDAAVEDLLVYARPKAPNRSHLDLAGLMRRVMIILREVPAFRGIDVQFEPPADGIEVAADEAQIQQVLMNILINAAHACDAVGRITCRIRAMPADALIEIEDNGVGIPPENLERVWEPFFTTRARGTGLGLAICKRIVEAHGGNIRLDSEPGVGTRVMINLPAESKGDSAATGRSEP